MSIDIEFYSVEVMVDTGGADGMPHTFLKIMDKNRAEHYRGFGPKEGSYSGYESAYRNLDGEISRKNHEFDRSSGSMPINKRQFQMVSKHFYNQKNRLL